MTTKHPGTCVVAALCALVFMVSAAGADPQVPATSDVVPSLPRAGVKDLPEPARSQIAALGASILTMPLSAGGREVVKIARDNFGVPHVYAQTDDGVFFGWGYAVAEDRQVQIEILRRTATGTLSEILGSSYVNTDYAIRRDTGGAAAAQREWDAFDDTPAGEEAVRLITAFVDGMNARLAGAGSRLRRWTPVDVIAYGRLLTYATERNDAVAAELNRQAFVQRLMSRGSTLADALDVAEDILYSSDPQALSSVEAGAVPGPPRAGAQPEVAHVSQAVLDAGVAESNALQRLFDSLGLYLGSQVWAVDGTRSETGAPMLFSTPGLGVDSPSRLHEVHLEGGSFHVAGVTFAGLPIVALGHSPFAAWGGTAGHADQTDVFVEQIRQAGDGSEYLHDGAWLPMKRHTEHISVLGGSAVDRDVFTTVHGPVFGFDLDNGVALSTARGSEVMGNDGTLVGFLQVMRATTSRQIDEGWTTTARSQGMVSADRGGNILFRFTGAVPRRALGFDGRLPAPGTGEADWQGLLSADEMPHILNPDTGYLASANNLPAPDFQWRQFQPGWGPFQDGRIYRIVGMLKEKPKLSYDDIVRIDRHFNIYNAAALGLTPFLLDSYDHLFAAGDPRAADPRFGRAIALLRAWDDYTLDGQDAGTEQPPAQAIFQMWLTRTRRGLFADQVGDDWTLSDAGTVYQVLSPATDHPKSRDYVDDVSTPQREDADDIIQRALGETLDRLATYYGTDDMDAWRSPGGTRTIVVTTVPGVPVPVGSVPNKAANGTWREAIVLNDSLLPREALLMPGNSESPASPHFRDQLEMFGRFELRPWLFDAGEVVENLESLTAVPYPPPASPPGAVETLPAPGGPPPTAPMPIGWLTWDGAPQSGPGTTTRGLWIDLNGSGAYEYRHDITTFWQLNRYQSLPPPQDPEVGTLGPDGQPQSAPGPNARGVWVDTTADGTYQPLRDTAIFLGDGLPAE